MQVNIEDNRIGESLMRKVHGCVSQQHNFVEIRMEKISRRVWSDILTALQKSSRFAEKKEHTTGCTFFLENRTIAERLGTDLGMYQLNDTQQFALHTTVKKRKSIFTDLPKVSVQVSTRTKLDVDSQKACKVRQFQYWTRHTFANSRGYEYELKVATPPGPLSQAEKALVRSEQQENSFVIRFALKNLHHSCFYHTINALNLFEQVFNPVIGFKLS
jgi:hypothetical protein